MRLPVFVLNVDSLKRYKELLQNYIGHEFHRLMNIVVFTRNTMALFFVCIPPPLKMQINNPLKLKWSIIKYLKCHKIQPVAVIDILARVKAVSFISYFRFCNYNVLNSRADLKTEYLPPQLWFRIYWTRFIEWCIYQTCFFFSQILIQF